MNTDYDDFRFAHVRRLLTESEIWRRPGEIALAIGLLNKISADESESFEKQAYAEKLKKQLCMAGKQPKVTYASTTAK